MHPVPWDILPLGLLARRELLLLDPLGIGYFGAVILAGPRKPLFLLQILVLEALHFRSKACQRFHDRDAELVQPIDLHTFRGLHRPVDLIETQIGLIGTGT
jgi:hypothetical protein